MAGLRWGALLAALMMSAAARSEPPVPSGFCQRLADQIGMRQVRTLGPGSIEIETKGAGAKLLFVGGYSFSIGVRAVSEATEPPDGNHCDVAAKGAACTIVGPAVLRLTVKGKVISTEARPDERADVQLVRSRIRCTAR